VISNPKSGWCDFYLGDFEGHPSYLTDVPVDLLTTSNYSIFFIYYRGKK